MTHRRGFLHSLGAAVMAVALDVLPTFQDVPQLSPDQVRRQMMWYANLIFVNPSRIAYLRGFRGFRDPFGPERLQPAASAPLAEIVPVQSEHPFGRAAER
jgi:hypothetical protein